MREKLLFNSLVTEFQLRLARSLSQEEKMFLFQLARAQLKESASSVNKQPLSGQRIESFLIN